MGKPAARLLDMHVCPMFDGPKPHGGGPITGPGVPTVMIGKKPAAVMGDLCTCVSPAPDSIALGSVGVMIGKKPAARLGDLCAHGGTIVLGAFNVLIGEVAIIPPSGPLTPWQFANQAALDQALVDAKEMLLNKMVELEKWDAATQANVTKWMGNADESTRRMLMQRIGNEINLIDGMNTLNFKAAEDPKLANAYAYVYSDDKTHTVYIGSAFTKAPATGSDSKAGTITHELSHFDDVGDTDDKTYGQKNSQNLAKSNPADAQKNADSFEYFIEH